MHSQILELALGLLLLRFPDQEIEPPSF
jgi:hypothetical protein